MKDNRRIRWHFSIKWNTIVEWTYNRSTALANGSHRCLQSRTVKACGNQSLQWPCQALKKGEFFATLAGWPLQERAAALQRIQWPWIALQTSLNHGQVGVRWKLTGWTGHRVLAPRWQPAGCNQSIPCSIPPRELWISQSYETRRSRPVTSIIVRHEWLCCINSVLGVFFGYVILLSATARDHLPAAIIKTK